MTIYNIDDLEDKRKDEDKEKFKKDVVQDINEVTEKVFNNLDDLFKRKKIEKENKAGFIDKIIKIVLTILAILTIIDLTLGGIWLLKFFVKELFL
jgi:hypothetical protein